MQMAMCCTTHGYFIIWTINDFFIGRINYDRDMWNKLHIDASFFFKSYVLPVLLGQKDLCFCPNCSKVVLEGDEIGPFPYAVDAQCMPEVWYQNYFQGKWLLSGWRFCLEE